MLHREQHRTTQVYPANRPGVARKTGRAALCILIAGIVFSIYLQTLIKGEVFYSGDMGLKLLQTKQFTTGVLRLDLDLNAPRWVRDLWTEGAFPFKPPFVYARENRYFVQYPFPFTLVSAPFYAWFGFRGLYLIPLISAWVLWARCLVVCRRLGMNGSGQALTLTAMIFASPLTVYSAMFWEHSPAVALAFCGLSVILLGLSEGLSRFQAALGGCLIGLSAWFRPECLCLVAVMVVLLPFMERLKMKLDHRALLAASMVSTVLSSSG